MNILISGGSGFLGRAFTHQFKDKYRITWLSRHCADTPSDVECLDYTELKITDKTFDVIINLAGSNIADKRWSKYQKQYLLDSRLIPTQAILDYIARIDKKPKLLISGSAIGWYGVDNTHAQTLDENSDCLSSDLGNDFAHELCQQWETLAKQAAAYNVHTTIIRTGVVLSAHGGMTQRLVTPFKLGLGGRLGSGKQIISWISVHDWVCAVDFIITRLSDKLSIANIYNLTAPTPVNNREFTKAVGQWLNRPTIIPMPVFLLKLIFGEMSTLLIDGQTVQPNQLINDGFEFCHHSPFNALTHG
ncbi:MAG: TIGR01777 family oxidoreductase [Moraxella sp.]|nr:TIGR01777 family oxidoreductase [Moraxella sp.]